MVPPRAEIQDSNVPKLRLKREASPKPGPQKVGKDTKETGRCFNKTTAKPTEVVASTEAPKKREPRSATRSSHAPLQKDAILPQRVLPVAPRSRTSPQAPPPRAPIAPIATPKDNQTQRRRETPLGASRKPPQGAKDPKQKEIPQVPASQALDEAGLIDDAERCRGARSKHVQRQLEARLALEEKLKREQEEAERALHLKPAAYQPGRLPNPPPSPVKSPRKFVLDTPSATGSQSPLTPRIWVPPGRGRHHSPCSEPPFPRIRMPKPIQQSSPKSEVESESQSTGPAALEGRVQLPNGMFLLPGGALLMPDGSVRLPDGRLQYPDGAFATPFPDGSYALQDGTVLLPNAELRLQSGLILTPTGATRQLDGTLTTVPQWLPLHDASLEHRSASQGCAIIESVPVMESSAEQEARALALAQAQASEMHGDVEVIVVRMGEKRYVYSKASLMMVAQHAASQGLDIAPPMPEVQEEESADLTYPLLRRLSDGPALWAARRRFWQARRSHWDGLQGCLPYAPQGQEQLEPDMEEGCAEDLWDMLSPSQRRALVDHLFQPGSFYMDISPADDMEPQPLILNIEMQQSEEPSEEAEVPQEEVAPVAAPPPKKSPKKSKARQTSTPSASLPYPGAVYPMPYPYGPPGMAMSMPYSPFSASIPYSPSLMYAGGYPSATMPIQFPTSAPMMNYYSQPVAPAPAIESYQMPMYPFVAPVF